MTALPVPVYWFTVSVLNGPADEAGALNRIWLALLASVVRFELPVRFHSVLPFSATSETLPAAVVAEPVRMEPVATTFEPPTVARGTSVRDRCRRTGSSRNGSGPGTGLSSVGSGTPVSGGSGAASGGKSEDGPTCSHCPLPETLVLVSVTLTAPVSPMVGPLVLVSGPRRTRRRTPGTDCRWRTAPPKPCPRR